MVARHRRRSPIVWAIVCSIALSACQYANLATIARQTRLPPPAMNGNGLAIHLDAQQRLLIYGRDGNYCAEPSPDALASFAASLGAAAAVPGQGTGSLSTAFNSAAASIGLRTQSITLMRDALYRLCEAHANHELNSVDATLLLARSQDLTAVVVAVEQLTGAVAANQVALTGTADSGASAAIITDQIALDAADKAVETKEAALRTANSDLATAKAAVTAKETAANTANTAAMTAMPPSQTLNDQAATAAGELTTARTNQTTAEANVKTATQARDDAVENREIIRNHQNALRTQVNASASTAAQFSSVAARNQLSKEATESIARAVNEMVQTVLRKDYTLETCSTLLTTKDLNQGANLSPATLSEFQRTCLNLISARAQLGAAQASAQATALAGSVATILDTNLRKISDKLGAATFIADRNALIMSAYPNGGPTAAVLRMLGTKDAFLDYLRTDSVAAGDLARAIP